MFGFTEVNSRTRSSGNFQLYESVEKKLVLLYSFQFDGHKGVPKSRAAQSFDKLTSHKVQFDLPDGSSYNEIIINIRRSCLTLLLYTFLYFFIYWRFKILVNYTV